MSFEALIIILKGSSTSGNWGHAGIPGHWGGSASGGGYGAVGGKANLSKSERAFVAAVRRQARNKKVEPKKVEPKKVEPKKVEPKKENAGKFVEGKYVASSETDKVVTAIKSKLSELESKQVTHAEAIKAAELKLQSMIKEYEDPKTTAARKAELEKLGTVQQEQVTKAHAAYQNFVANSDVSKEIGKLVQTSNPAAVKPNRMFSHDGDPKVLEDGFAAFNNLVSKSVLANVTKANVQGGVTRSHCDVETNNLVISKTAPPRTVVHELGHFLENSNADVRNKVYAFYDYRTKGEKPVKLSEVTKNKAYDDAEVTKLDKFDNPYVGKDYVSGGKRYGTEILSMGIEALHTDPAGFYKKDPEYFSFVLDTINGR